MPQSDTKEVNIYEERFRLVSLATQDTIWDWDITTNYIWWNEGFKIMFGYSEEEIGHNVQFWEDKIHPSDREKVMTGIHTAIEQGVKNWSDKYRFKHKNGTYRLVLDRGFALHDQDGKSYRMVGSMIDITETEQTKKDLETSEDRLKLAIASTGIGAWDLNPQTNELKWDERCKELFSLPPDAEASYDLFLQGIHPEDRERTHQAVLKALTPASGGKYDIEFRIIGIQDKREHWVKTKGKAYFNKEGEAVRFIGTVFEITESKIAEIKLKESEERFKTLADSSPIFIWMADAQARITYSNKTWSDYTGMNTGNADGDAWKKVIHPEDSKALFDTYTTSFNAKLPYSAECRIRGKDGNYRWFLYKGEPLELSDKSFSGFIGIGVDIHDRKEVEKALSESLERFLFLAEAMPQKVWTAKADGKVNYLNNRWLKYTGSTMKDIKNWNWSNVIHPDDLEESNRLWADGVSLGKDWEMKHRLRREDGVYRWHLSRGIPQKDLKGKVRMWVGTSTDIHNEVITLQQIEQANKDLQKTNNDLDNFIYTASHDLKAPISNIEGLINALPETVSEKNNEDFSTIMEFIKTSITKFKQTILDLTDITRVQKNIAEDVGEVDICDLIDEIIKDLAMEIQRSEAIIRVDTSQCPSIHFSRKNLRSIIYNLLSNAIKYRSPARQPEIGIHTNKSNGYVVITIQDNGLGIPKEKINRVFDMFRRMHSHVEGTGIGLYIVKRIVENSGGKIEVESEVNKGSAFKVFLKDS